MEQKSLSKEGVREMEESKRKRLWVNQNEECMRRLNASPLLFKLILKSINIFKGI